MEVFSEVGVDQGDFVFGQGALSEFHMRLCGFVFCMDASKGEKT